MKTEYVNKSEAFELIVAAALYDFGGYLTSRKERIVASTSDNAAPMAEAIKEFCEMRGINPSQEIPVLSWQEWIAPSQEAEPVNVERMRKRFNEIESEICEGKHTASSVFTQMRTAALYAAQPPAVAVQDVDDDDNQWRNLALQFDRHRIAAMSLIKAVAKGTATAEDCAKFVELPPPEQPAPVPTSELPAVEGDCLPQVGSKVLIHLASPDSWVEREVVGFYAWGDHKGQDHLHRVFVRVKDTDGTLNARLLKDVIIPPSRPQNPEVADG